MLKKISYIFTKRQKRNTVILLFLTLIGSCIELVGVSAIMPLVSVVSDPSIIETDTKYRLVGNILGIHDARTYVLALAMFLIVVYIVKNVYVCMQYNLQYRFVYNNQQRLSKQMLDYYVHQDYLYHTATNVSVLQRNISSDVNFCFDVVLNMLSFTNEALVCIAIVTYLAVVDFSSTIAIAILMILFLAVFVLFFKRYSVELGRRTREAGAVQGKWLLQSFAGIKEIKVMNKENFFISNFAAESAKVANLHRKQSFATILPKPVMETVCICGLLATMSVKIYLGGNMAQFVPILSVFAVAAFRMMPSINRLSGCYSAIMFGKSAVESVYKDVVEMNANKQIRTQEETDDYVFEIQESIKVNDLTFKYPLGDENVLSGASFEIQKLKSTALVGPSGAGKSTMADLLLGILTPSAGTITVDGVDIAKHMKSWHMKIGYIPQVIYLMDDTIRANVAFGVPADEIDDDKVWRALKEAQLDDFVREQPDGLYSEVGDRGVRISGGQRQRIGIARALYTDPEVLVLDEATSALDNETETAVMESIDALHGSRTMVIIAHRLTTIRNCDNIFEVKDGKVTLRDKDEVLNSINTGNDDSEQKSDNDN